MANVFEQLQFAIGSLCQDGSAKRLHDLLYSDALSGELVLCRAHETECAHPDGLKVDIACRDFEDTGRDVDSSVLERGSACTGCRESSMGVVHSRSEDGESGWPEHGGHEDVVGGV